MIRLRSLSEQIDDSALRGLGNQCSDLCGHGTPVQCCKQQSIISTLLQSGVGLAVLSTKLRVLEVNAEFYQQFGQSRASVIDRHFCELLHPSVRPGLWEKLTRLAQGHSTSVGKMPVLWAHAPGSVNGVSAMTKGELSGFTADCEISHRRTIVVLVKNRSAAAPPAGENLGKILTDLDARILEGVAMGMTTMQLAGTLYLSHQGVAYHIGTMMRKFDVPNRTALASKAFSTGIFRVGYWPPRVLPDYVSQ